MWEGIRKIPHSDGVEEPVLTESQASEELCSSDVTAEDVGHDYSMCIASHTAEAPRCLECVPQHPHFDVGAAKSRAGEEQGSLQPPEIVIPLRSRLGCHEIS